jgi:UDP-4-amino-4-deoxy-L-arabinose formyltransferase/UDP-glucuronic acid dehydrogenase (UDP-4-keto-hexauronic acid decarboxylating)
MKAVVFAYHNMGVLGITKLLEHGFEIPLVFTHEDSPNENVWFGSVAKLCAGKGIPFVTPGSPNAPEWTSRIASLEPDIIFSFYYRHMIQADILGIPPLGAYNLHGSLLPRFRGRAPVNWVLVKGEKTTGVTLHEMVEKPDAGDIVAQEAVDIGPEDTAVVLFGRLEEAASRMLDAVLPRIRRRDIPRQPQDLSKGSYFGGRKPEDGRIAWDRSAREAFDLIRGVTRPYPGAFGFLGEKKILFWWARPVEDARLDPGAIAVENGTVRIGTSSGVLVPLEIEADGAVYKDREVYEYFKPHEGECMK